MVMKTNADTIENFIEVSQKINTRTIIWSSNSKYWYLSGENENTNSKRYMHPIIHCSIIYDSQPVEATKVSIDRWMDKDVKHIYRYIHIYSYI